MDIDVIILIIKIIAFIGTIYIGIDISENYDYDYKWWDCIDRRRFLFKYLIDKFFE